MSAGAVIIGVGALTGHDSGAAILVDGRLVAACEEERLSRVKHDASFPSRSLEFCLETAGVPRESVTHVALGFHPTAAMARRLRFLLEPSELRNARVKLGFLRNLTTHTRQTGKQLETLFPQARLVYVEHHLAHAASAFYASAFDDAAILSMDGRGEWSTALTGSGSGTTMEPLARAYYPESLGLLYEAFTTYLGFGLNDEYKVMGLSSYGVPEQLEVFRRIFRADPDSIYRVERSWLRHPGYVPIPWGAPYFTDEVVAALGPPRQPEAEMEERHRNIAKSLQTRLEEVGVEIARELRARTGRRHLVIGGGLGLNGLMNYAIKKQAGFDDVFVQPAANDGGISVGAALYVQHQVLGMPRGPAMSHAYWGPELDDGDVEREVAAIGLPAVELEDPARAAACLIAENKIIGWCQGRQELGPRALGNRSILADPRDPENKDRVNARIKFREEFRPFAPSVLEEHAGDYFEGIDESPYMLLICPVRKEMQARIPAVVHVDGTARPQTVAKDTNPRYYALIEHFQRLTGVPVVLNTSFNVKGEPIVTSPLDALRCFQSTGLDYLVLGSRLVAKTESALEDARRLVGRAESAATSG